MFEDRLVLLAGIPGRGYGGGGIMHTIVHALVASLAWHVGARIVGALSLSAIISAVMFGLAGYLAWALWKRLRPRRGSVGSPRSGIGRCRSCGQVDRYAA